MLGVECSYPIHLYTVALNALAQAGLGYLISSLFPLNCHQVRCLPTTSALLCCVLSLRFSFCEAHIDRVIQGFGLQKRCSVAFV